MFRIQTFVHSLAACAMLTLAGCGGGTGIHDLNGNVTLDGQPIPFGYIEFTPDTAKGNSGGRGHAEINNGKYDTSIMPGRGVIGGPHKVRITAYEAKPAGGSGNDDTPVAGSEVKPICVGYEMDADLPTRAGPHDITLPSAARGYNESQGGYKSPTGTDA